MANKLRSNAPCPCGSGKKYKKCCLKKGVEYNKQGNLKGAPQFTVDHSANFFSRYSMGEMVAHLAALSLNPRNHGKNIRLDMLTAQALRHGNDEVECRVDVIALKNFTDTHHASFYMEDPPEALFTEAIRSSIGTTVSYNGNFYKGSGILNLMIQALEFNSTDSLPESFTQQFLKAARLLLTFLQRISNRLGHTRNMVGGYHESGTEIEYQSNVGHEASACYMSEEFVQGSMEYLEVNEEILQHFCIQAEDRLAPKALKSLDIYIHRKPLLKLEQGILVASPTSIVSALVHYGWSLATRMGCNEEFAREYHLQTKRELQKVFTKLTVNRTEAIVEKHIDSLDSYAFKVDADKIIVFTLLQDPVREYDTNTLEHMGDQKESTSLLESSYEIINEIKNNHPECTVAQVMVLSTTGRLFGLSGNQVADYSMFISYQDLVALAFGDDHEELSLWYFMEAYERNGARRMFGPVTSILDIYAQYTDLKSFYMNDNAVPSMIWLQDIAIPLLKKAKDTFDTIMVLKNHPDHTNPVLVPVTKADEFVSKYINVDSMGAALDAYIPNYPVDLWISIPRIAEQSRVLSDIQWKTSEAMAYWLEQFQPELSTHLKELPLKTTTIIVKIEDIDHFLQLNEEKAQQSIQPKLPTILIEDGALVYTISGTVSQLLMTSDNAGEREMANILLQGFGILLEQYRVTNTLSQKTISNILDKRLPLGLKKMILNVPTNRNPALNPVDTSFPRWIQQARTQYWMDQILTLLGDKKPAIGVVTDRKKYARDITTALTEQLIQLLHHYDGHEFIEYCMKQYEWTLHLGASMTLTVPTQLACFADNDQIVKNLKERMESSDETTLSLRCVIEVLVAEQPKGTNSFTMQAYDDALALMTLIITWGGIGDAIHHNLFAIEVSVLESGRAGTNLSEIQNKFFSAYKEAWMSLYTDKAHDTFDDNFDTASTKGKDIPGTLEKAFHETYGISISKLGGIMRFLSEYSFQNEHSYMQVPISKIVDLIKKNFEEQISTNEVNAGIDLLSLKFRGKAISKPPSPFDFSDITPWGYNRRLSYIQRPLIIWSIDGVDHAIWTPRHVVKSWGFLNSLISSTRLKVPENSPLKAVMSKVSKDRGQEVVEDFKKWVATYETLQVEEEVFITPHSALKNDQDIGDCDLLVFDHKKKVIISIECKRTTPAKNMTQMVDQVSTYFGDSGYFSKHLRRDIWLKQNLAQVGNVYGVNATDYVVHSMFLTYELMAIQYNQDRPTPLPMMSLPELRHMDYDRFLTIATHGS